LNTSLLASIKWVISQHGESILGNPVKLNKYLANHIKNEPKEERIAFGRCIELGFYREIKKAKNINERSQIKTTLTYKLQRRKSININLCKDALDILDTAIYGNTAPFMTVQISYQQANSYNKIVNQILFLWKKPKIKWVGLGIIGIIIIAITFSVMIRTNTNNIIPKTT